VKHRVFLENIKKFVEAEGGTLRQRSLRDRVKAILKGQCRYNSRSRSN